MVVHPVFSSKISLALLTGRAQGDVMLSLKGFHLKNSNIFKVRNLEKRKVEDNI